MSLKLPNVKTPCKDCPMTKGCRKGWLGRERMKSILEGELFVCHKDTSLQCAGHMLIKGEENDFVRLAKILGHKLKLTGRKKVFDTVQECIDHHDFERE